jgi:hypothetical protein
MEQNDTWIVVHLRDRLEDYTMPATWLQSKYPAPIQAGQVLKSFDTDWLKMALSIGKDHAEGYGEVW